MFLLDTNVISELRRPARANANVQAWSSSAPAALFHLSAITILELEMGVLLMERRDQNQGALLRRWFESHVLAGFEKRILPIDQDVAQACARLHVPNPRPDRDALIAATAIVHGMTIVTRNVGAFEGTGANLLNPWNA